MVIEELMTRNCLKHAAGRPKYYDNSYVLVAANQSVALILSDDKASEGILVNRYRPKTDSSAECACGGCCGILDRRWNPFLY